MKITHKLCFRMNGTQFDGLQLKMRAGSINENECTSKDKGAKEFVLFKKCTNL